MVVWKDWCRLCSADKECDVDLFTNKNSSDELQKTIEKYFSISLSNNDKSSTKICRNCNGFLKKLQNFTNHVRKVDAMFLELAEIFKSFVEDNDIHIDVHIRKKYGIQDDYHFDKQQITYTETNDSIIEDVFVDVDNSNIRKMVAEIKSEPSRDKYKMSEESEENDIVSIESNEITKEESVLNKPTRLENNIATDNMQSIIENELKLNEVGSQSYSEDDPDDDECSEIENNEKKSSKTTAKTKVQKEEEVHCKLCNKTYTHKKYYKRHVQRIHNENYECTICEKKFATENGLKRHVINPCSKEKELYCKLCDKTYTQEKYYKRHVQTIHTTKYRHRCTICGKKYATEVGIKRHEESHKDVQKVTCEICAKTFSSVYACRNHQEVHLPLDKKKKLKHCPYCEKKFVALKSHILNHHSGERERSFVCEICGKSFLTKQVLIEHRDTHFDETHYDCPHCSKKFRTTQGLRVHVQKHSEKKFVCSHCGSKFSSRPLLTAHMVKHSDVKKHKCEYCGSEFKRTRALQIHLIHHTGLRPYMCRYCNKSFVYDCSLRAHMKRLHANEFAELQLAGKTILSCKSMPKLEQLKVVVSSVVAEDALIEVPKRKQRGCKEI